MVTALIEGAKAGLAGTATKLVVDAYDTLKSLVVGLLRRGGTAADTGRELVEQANGGATDSSAALTSKLEAAGVDDPTEEAARRLLELLNSAGAKFNVHAPDAKGLIIGDHATQHNTFN
ncbi:hypothetical protein [Catellatospora vulcania]|uniref:hypothetical protein n=1 Tax=Catellatospora vulcania TaxID=1460450 RepID=UPI0018AF586C|nr:hypothetical protein [Catellatospora vulcania]